MTWGSLPGFEDQRRHRCISRMVEEGGVTGQAHCLPRTTWAVPAWLPTIALRYQDRLADHRALFDQLERLHPVCEIETAGHQGPQLAFGEPAHQFLLRLHHHRATPGERLGLLRCRRRLAAPAVVVAVVEADHRHVLHEK